MSSHQKTSPAVSSTTQTRGTAMNPVYELGRTLRKSAMGGGMHYGNPKPKPKPKLNPKNKRDHKPGGKMDYKDMPDKKANLHPMVQQLHAALVKASAAKAEKKQAARQLKIAQAEMAGTNDRAADFLQERGLNNLAVVSFTQAMEKSARSYWSDFLSGAGKGALTGGVAGGIGGGLLGGPPGALGMGAAGALGGGIYGGVKGLFWGTPEEEAAKATGGATGKGWGAGGRDILAPEQLYSSDPMMRQMMLAGLRRQAMQQRYRTMQQYLNVGPYGMGGGGYGPSAGMR